MVEDIPLVLLALEETDRVVAAGRDHGELPVVAGHAGRLVELAVVAGGVATQSQAGLHHHRSVSLHVREDNWLYIFPKV